MKYVYRVAIPLLVFFELGAQAAIFSQEKSIHHPIVSIQFSGGSNDDRSLALLASGLKVNEIYYPEKKDVYISAIKLTDRFSQVSINDSFIDSGIVLLVTLDPWPKVIRHQGLGSQNIPPVLAKEFRRLSIDRPLGDLELEKRRQELIKFGADHGYPNMQLSFSRSRTLTEVDWNLDLGAPNQINEIKIQGLDGHPLLLKIETLVNDRDAKDLWSETLQSRLSQKLEKLLLSERYFQSSFSFLYNERGQLEIQFELGPQTAILYRGELLGSWVGTKSLEEILGLTTLNASINDLLDVAKFRLEKYYKDQGYLQVQVVGTLEKNERLVNRPSQELRLDVTKGSLFRIGSQSYRGNIAFSRDILEASLVEPIPTRKPQNPLEQIKTLQSQLISFYDSQGYFDITVFPQIELDSANSRVNISWIIDEGKKQESQQFELDFAKGLPLTPDYLKSSLSLLIKNESTDEDFVTADRPLMEGRKGRYEATARKEKEINLTLYVDKPIPVSQTILSEVLKDLRFKLARAGFKNPQVIVDVEDQRVKFSVPSQPFDSINRIIIRGLDITKASTVLKQLKVQSGSPVDPQQFIASQINLSLLNAFDQIDFDSLDRIDPQKETWSRGDILLNLEEKGRWDYTAGLGYDRSQGYYVIGGIQRNNINGQGRTLNLDIRAGDNTLRNPTLRKWFPTGQGQNNRSIDSYALGYTDPSPGFIRDWFDHQVIWRNQGAYIEESQAAYFARRRIFTSEFEWRIDDLQLRLGERFERTDFNPQSYQINLADFLLEVARTNKQTYTISAPYLIATIDQRDRPIDPTRGFYFSSRFDLATQMTGTSRDSSFLKIDLRAQWNVPIGFAARYGVFMMSGRLGIAKPTASVVELPLSERFYGGGPNSVRGVGSDLLGPIVNVQLRDTQGQPLAGSYQYVPTGGEVLGFASMEYRFPIWGQNIWAEIFLDSGQVYSKLNPGPRSSNDPAPFPSWRTTVGVGLIFKIGIPIKIEFAQDWKRLLKQYRTPLEIQTELRGVLVSAGYQF